MQPIVPINGHGVRVDSALATLTGSPGSPGSELSYRGQQDGGDARQPQPRFALAALKEAAAAGLVLCFLLSPSSPGPSVLCLPLLSTTSPFVAILIDTTPTSIDMAHQAYVEDDLSSVSDDGSCHSEATLPVPASLEDDDDARSLSSVDSHDSYDSCFSEEDLPSLSVLPHLASPPHLVHGPVRSLTTQHLQPRSQEPRRVPARLRGLGPVLLGPPVRCGTNQRLWSPLYEAL